MKPLISVGVPIYNVDKFLNDCLTSIQNQSYENIEIICVDDGSTDKSGKIADKFAADDERFKVIHTANGGSCVARNLILDNFKGDYLSFIDSDDVIDKNFLFSLYDALLVTQADISVCNMIWNYDIVIDAVPHVFNGDEIISAYIMEKIPSNQDYIICQGVCNKLYTRKVVEDTRFPTAEGGGIRRDRVEDSVWTPNVLVKANRLVQLATPLYHYRQRLIGLARGEKSLSENVGMELNLLNNKAICISHVQNEIALTKIAYDYLAQARMLIMYPFVEIGNFYELIRYIAINNQVKLLKLFNGKPLETQFINLLIQNDDFNVIREFIASNMFGGKNL